MSLLRLKSTIAFLVALSAISLVGLTSTSFAEPDPAAIEFFESKIRPVLIENCYNCHSLESNKSKGGLRLDDSAALLKGGDSGPAIVPSDPEASLLLRALRYTDNEIQMPPDGKLDASVIADFESWIKMGAPDPRHSDAPAPTTAALSVESSDWWSFQPLSNPTPPDVKNAAWVSNPIDAFLLSKLESQNLSPAPAADKRTLLRRATFDLTGLPPAPAELSAFLADESSDAFARVVDRLLASPQYGEQWGRHWLDVVRYTDSFDTRAGVAQDCTEAWKYRDWVVRSFNRDLPYDQFLTMQIAGDLMAESEGGYNADALVATAVLAFGNWPGGDADKEKMVTDIVDDQLDLVTRGFMGVTLACARCHDHKFDPFTARDYYSMAGIFFSSHILPGPGQKTEGSPILKIPVASRAEMEQRAAWQSERARVDADLRRLDELRSRAIALRMLPQTARYITAAWNSSLATTELPADLNSDALMAWRRFLALDQFKYMDQPVTSVAGIVGVNAWQSEGGIPSIVANANQTEAVFATIIQPAYSVSIHPKPTGSVAVGWRSPISGRVSISGRVIDADNKCGEGINWSIRHRNATGDAELLTGSIPNGDLMAFKDAEGASRIESVEIRAGDMLELHVLPGTSHGCDTTVAEFLIRELGGEERYWNLTEDVTGDLHAQGRGNPHTDKYGTPDIWHFLDYSANPADAAKHPGSALDAFREAARQADWVRSQGGEPGPAQLEAIARAAEAIQSAIMLEAISLSTPAAETDSSNLKLARELTSSGGPFWGRGDASAQSALPLARELHTIAQARLAALDRETPPTLEYTVGIQEGGVPNTPTEGIRDIPIHIRGSYSRLGEVAPRAMPAVLARTTSQPEIGSGSGRAALARWIASPENPLTARVMVNRIWQHHFGEGIVRTPGNFGKLGELPSNPELLDWLARRFIDSGWSLKEMHRLIMLSSAYQTSSAPTSELHAADPANRLFGHANRRRLSAEQLRDSLLAVSGELDLTPGGLAFPDLETPRRTLYLKTNRSDRATYRSLFDAADPTAIVDKRTEATVAPQALYLMNHPFVMARAGAMTKKLMTDADGNFEGRINWLYEHLYSRNPRPEEIQIAFRILGPSPDARAYESLAVVLLCANEFMYLD